jgi:hypothetical protein
MSEAASEIAAGKACGSCGMCGKVLAIQVLDKPGGVWCGAYRKGAGCGVYDTRPAPCRGFHCLWLTSEKLSDDWRPDRAGFLMYTDRDGKRLNVVVDPGKPAAWRREPYYQRLKAMSRRALDGYELVICVGDRRIVLFPSEDVDLGVVDPDHKLVSGYADRDGQKVPFAMVLKDAG